MKCEQWVHFAAGSFFNFNGTAGMTVEDMDLSLRAYVAGWRAVFVEDVCVPNELPSSYFAYRKQQHRWTCGPIQLWRRASSAIWTSKLPWLRKLEINFLYFMLRKTSSHFVSLGFFCFLVPLSVYTPEVSIPLWALLHLPVSVTLCTAFFTRRGWLYSIVHVLFENSMSVVKLWAVLNGLFDLGRAHEWIVTAKAGSSDKKPGLSLAAFRSCRVYAAECVIGIFIVAAAFHSIFFIHRWTFAIFLALQGCVFFAFGLSLVDSGGLLGRPLRQYSMAACLPNGSSKMTKESKLVLPSYRTPSRVERRGCSIPMNTLGNVTTVPISQMA